MAKGGILATIHTSTKKKFLEQNIATYLSQYGKKWENLWIGLRKAPIGEWSWMNSGSNGHHVKVTDWDAFENIWGKKRHPLSTWTCFLWEPFYLIEYWFPVSCAAKRGFICQFRKSYKSRQLQ